MDSACVKGRIRKPRWWSFKQQWRAWQKKKRSRWWQGHRALVIYAKVFGGGATEQLRIQKWQLILWFGGSWWFLWSDSNAGWPARTQLSHGQVVYSVTQLYCSIAIGGVHKIPNRTQKYRGINLQVVHTRDSVVLSRGQANCTGNKIVITQLLENMESIDGVLLLPIT